MPTLRQIFCLILFSHLLFPAGSRAQFSPKDSLTESVSYNNAVDLYHAYLKPEPGLYRGCRYTEYSYSLSAGHPFFGDGQMHMGNTLYNGVRYENIKLWYDMVKDLVVITSPYGAYKVYLVSGQVESFSIEDHNFVRLSDSLNPSAPRNGFYEQLYEGKISLLKKNKKFIREDLQLTGVRGFIDSTLSYYVKKGNTYYSVGSKKGLLRAYKDRSKDVSRFIRQNKLSMRKDTENTLIKVTAWYDGQTHQ